MRILKQSTTYNLAVFMTQDADHVTGAAGLSLTITASKDGGSFSSITPTVTELSSGWYKLALTTSHTDTLGDLALHVTATGADPTDLAMQVRANVLGDTLPANLLQSLGNALNAGAAAGFVPVDVMRWASGVVPAPNVSGVPKVDTNYVLGTGVYQGAASGHFPADALRWVGGVIPAPSVAGVPKTDLTYTRGTASSGAPGYIGPDWGAVANPTTTLNLSGTSVKTAADVETDTQDIQSRLPAALSADGYLKADLQTVAGNASGVVGFDRAVRAIGYGTVSSGTASGIVPSLLVPSGVDSGQFVGRILVFENTTPSSGLRGQATDITAYATGNPPTLSFTALTSTPASGDRFTIQ
jgi:hypothetical protein